MNFSEFKHLLGAEPRSRDEEFLRARHSSPDFEAAAAEADRFETLLERCLQIPAPDGLLDDLLSLGRQSPVSARGRRWLPMALAASILVAVGAAGLTWKMTRGWDSVEAYVIDHYRHEGILAPADTSAAEIRALFAGLNVEAAPALADIVSVIKYCPTPDGKGVHMILNTESGPVTVLYMPGTAVSDQQAFAFDGVEAILVELQVGSAAIIGPNPQSISGLYAFIQDSIKPAPENS